MAHSVRRHLDLAIDEYDATIRRWIPGYDRMLEVAADAVARSGARRVVDLGSGTGALSEAMLGRTGSIEVQLIDVDPEMMDRARLRLARFGDRADFSLRSFEDPFEPSDAFAASLSLHHIPTLAAKAELFSRAFDALSPGGVLVNADCCMPAESGEREELFGHWADHQVGQGITEEEAYAHFEAWAAEDTYLPLEDELEALRGIGFGAERVWNDGPIGVVVAQRPD